MKSQQELVLVRGLPGTGKTTLAKAMGYFHVEADQFFTDDYGQYNYDQSLIHEAHAWCRNACLTALSASHAVSVVVSNTFTRLAEMQPYFDIAKQLNIPVRVIEATGNFKNIHNVPSEVIERMRERWELLPANFEKTLGTA